MMRWITFILLLALTVRVNVPAQERAPLRVAVIGGIAHGDVWPRLTAAFEAESGVKIAATVTGQRERCAAALREGQADLAVMHAGAIPEALVKDGIATALHPWARNEMVIFGPTADPAGIRGLKDGVAALRRIAETNAAYVDFRGVGSRELARSLWEKAGIEPKNVVRDETASGSEILKFAAVKGAYVLVNRPAPGSPRLPESGVELLVQGDPGMRREFVVLAAARDGSQGAAKAFAGFLTGPAGQKIIREAAARSPAQERLLFPLGEE